MSAPLAGTGPLLRASIKHDGRNFVPWIVIVTVLSASSVLAYAWIFPDQQDRMVLAVGVGSNPALGIVFGPAFDLLTSEGFTAWRSLALGGFLTAIGSIFAVTKATRGQEDSGQAELLASGVLGRGSRLLVGIGMAFLGSLAVGLVAAVVTVLCGGGWQASLLLAATFTVTGWMFGAIAAVTAQLGSDSRTANSFAVGTLGVLFLLRGFAYSVDAPSWTIWANPLGWMTETRPASGDHWGPLAYSIALTAVVLVVAFVLQARRDFGQGVIAPRPGPARGNVRSTWRLALRLSTGPIITWAIGFAALGIVFGNFATSIQDILGQDSTVAGILAAGATTPEALTSAFLVTILSLVGILAAIPGVQIMLKVHTEETEGRVEPVLAGAVHRNRYYASNVILALAVPAVYLLIAGLLIAALASGADIGVDFGDALLQAVATVPAVWTITAVSIAVVGARPQVSIAAWIGVLGSFALTLLGPTFKLWDWAMAISPFWHIPSVTDTDADWAGLGWITLVTLALLVIGFIGFRRRDLAR